MEIAVGLAPSEFVDRFVICSLRAKKLQAAGRPHGSVAEWLRAHQESFDKLHLEHPALSKLTTRLVKIHARLWTLESRARSRASLRSGFPSVAREVFALNDVRHNVKAEIDIVCQATQVVERLYEELLV